MIPEIIKADFDRRFNRVKQELVDTKKTLEGLKQLDTKNITFNFKGDILYIKKIRKFYYLFNPNLKEGCCLICEKEKETTAHHVIPKRARTKNPILKELRLRCCDDCDKKLHPENLVDGDGIIDRQNRQIKNYKEKIENLKNRFDDKVLNYIAKRVEKLEKDIKSIPNQLKDNPRQIEPAIKLLSGRIIELKHIAKNYKLIMNGEKENEN